MNSESKLDLDNLPFSNISIPKGSLFHPSCGDDLYLPLMLFFDKIDTFHFADYKINGIELPKEIVKNCQRKKIKPEEKRIDLNMNPRPQIGWINLISQVRKDTWAASEKKKINICRHMQDGYLTFLGLDEISVFYYTHESGGEGGGAQYWLGKDLFPLVLDRLVNGGIIVTDGVNHGESKDYRWESKLRNGVEEFSFSNKDKKYKFKNIGHFQSKEKDVYVWKVNKLTNFITNYNMGTHQ